ncbi:hypothetical protein AMK16_29980 [Streptomyces sp. CB00455]|uniref:hypothetical protein n=1 Tax=Streptomyces sp. CB00455 TaxID=1703927 RepID=UPI00093CBAD0|nr:hypothetical protein [Streptomyces sp. CB00455]OKK14770.1 hypothetical protein AMK16_29980 [Streptomyces sp. CB00455]
MTTGRLRTMRDCRKYVRSLMLDPYSSAHELCDQIGSVRGRPIRVIEARLPIPGPMGVWVCRTDDDVVIVQDLAVGAHRDHIVLHELAHILCEHEGERYRHDEPALSALGHAPDGGAVVRFRSVHDSAAEREAELLAAAFAEFAIDDRAEAGMAWDVQRYFGGA